MLGVDCRVSAVGCWLLVGLGLLVAGRWSLVVAVVVVMVDVVAVTVVVVGGDVVGVVDVVVIVVVCV